MYNQLRNDVLVGLAQMDRETVNQVLWVLDQAAEKYEIHRKETALVPRCEGLPEVVKIYLVCKRMAGLTDATLENYRTVLEVFFREIQKQPDQITANEIRLWLYSYQQRNGISNRSLDKYREYIARFFSWAQDEGYIAVNPAKNVESIKYEEKPRQALNQVELEYLRLACRTSRELAIVEVLYSTGARVSELAGMKRSDVDWNEKSVHLFGKGRKHRTSWLNAKAEVALRVYLAERTDTCEALFISSRNPASGLTKSGIEKIVARIATRTNIVKEVSPHILRHTTATTALQSGMPISDIRILLGHENLETTMIYAETSVENVRAGHKRHIV